MADISFSHAITIHAKPLRVIANLRNHISIKHLHQKKRNVQKIHTQQQTAAASKGNRTPTKTCENKCTWRWLSASLKIYVTRNFPSFRFIFIFDRVGWVFFSSRSFFLLSFRSACNATLYFRFVCVWCELKLFGWLLNGLSFPIFCIFHFSAYFAFTWFRLYTMPWLWYMDFFLRLLHFSLRNHFSRFSFLARSRIPATQHILELLIKLMSTLSK